MNEETTPVIVGTGQLVDRDASIEQHIEPLEMLVRVARAAAQDAGISEAELKSVDTIALVGVAGWKAQNAPGLLAETLGANPRHNFSTGVGGQVGVTLTNFIGDKISKGEAEFAIVGGCNNLKVLMKAISQQIRLPWSVGGEGEATMVGGDSPGNTDLEKQYGLIGPPDIYPLFENALRAKLGLSLDDHRQRMGNLFTKFTTIAANNPYSWFPTERSSEELTTATATNRMIAWPYTKYLNAVLNTEQAASLLMMSAAKARKLGIPEENWVYWLGGASSEEQAWWTSERPDFAACPAMKDSTLSALHNSQLSLDQISHFDFYSCFPVAVEMACQMLGLDIDDNRGFTVCGGLPYAGGPASAYTLHSMACMVNKLRGETSSSGLVTGNGWYLTKHAATVLSTDPHSSGELSNVLLGDLPSAHMEINACPVNQQASGEAVIETYTVRYDRSGQPEQGIVLGRMSGGDRFMANTTKDVDFLKEFVTAERVGTPGKVELVNGLSTFTPN
ncbi:MAG: acetyl-CoA acetyltransferase [Pseudomonadales bacterium]